MTRGWSAKNSNKNEYEFEEYYSQLPFNQIYVSRYNNMQGHLPKRDLREQRTGHSKNTNNNKRNTKRNVCFAYQKGKCHAGNSCKYSHDTTTVGGNGGGSAHVVARGVCHNFLSGHCNRGDSCRYSHDSKGVATQRARGATGALDQPWKQLMPGRTLAEAQAAHMQLMPMLMQGDGGRGRGRSGGGRGRGGGRGGGHGGRKRRANNDYGGGGGRRVQRTGANTSAMVNPRF